MRAVRVRMMKNIVDLRPHELVPRATRQRHDGGGHQGRSPRSIHGVDPLGVPVDELIGLAIGATAGYFGGWIDRINNIFFINAFLSFPGILLAIAFAAFMGPGITKVILALVITGWAGYARLARAQVLQTKEFEYVLAARSLGASHARILLRHALLDEIEQLRLELEQLVGRV